MENNMQEIIETKSTVEPKQNEPKPEVVNIKEKRSGKDERSRKKDDKSIEHILKSVNGLNTPEEKLSAMCKKYNEIIDENRKLQMNLKLMEKKIIMTQREKEQCQSDKSKAVLAKSRLESLCRELQRQNKAVKEESLLKSREEDEKRKEVSAKFQSMLTELKALMAETNDKNLKLQEDNIETHIKFKSVFHEMDIREQHFESMHQVMKQKLKVADAKLTKVTLEMTEERENLLKEKNLLLLKLTEYQSKIKDLQAVEANLRSQVEMYTEKYDEFQNALSKSNEIFGGFNTEMEKMSKKILELEEETNMWKTRWEKSHATLLEMATDKQTRDAEILQLNKKCQLFQELCKAFQQERATLLVQLKEKTNNTLQSDSNKLDKNIGEESLLNELSSLNKINDEPQTNKTEKITTKEDDSNTENEEIRHFSIDSKEKLNENAPTAVAPEIIDANTAVTNSDADKIIGENHVEIKNKTDVIQVPVETKNISKTSTTETAESNSKQVTTSLEPGNNTEILKHLDTEKTTEVPDHDNVSIEQNHIDNSDALISSGTVQNAVNDEKPKDGKRKIKK